MSIPIEQVPSAARDAWLRLRDQLVAILGDDLVAVWAYGGTVSAPDGVPMGDLDTFVVVRRAIDGGIARAIETRQAAIAEDAGIEWDTWYVVEADARRREQPRHAFRDRLNESWAIDRAHWLAGRYVLLHGSDPADIVPAPSSEEIAAALHGEVEHLERHVEAGDTDPYEATYAFLNGSRIVRAAETGDVAISKREAGAWGAEHLGARWLPAVEAARRAYDGQASPADTDLLAREMAPFVAMVRQRLTTGT
jgi:hypothetical protein